jgi:hypothetical protein
MSNNKERKDIGFKETRPIYVDFKQDCIREGIDCNEQLTKLMEDYHKKHGDGNPVYPITKWFGNADFKAVPALLSNDAIWINYAQHANDDTLKEILEQNRRTNIIINCYLKTPKEDRPNIFYPNLREMAKK